MKYEDLSLEDKQIALYEAWEKILLDNERKEFEKRQITIFELNESQHHNA